MTLPNDAAVNYDPPDGTELVELRIQRADGGVGYKLSLLSTILALVTGNGAPNPPNAGIAMRCLGLPPTSSEVMDAIVFDRAYSFPANFAGARQSYGKIKVLPTATFVASINKNGTPIGSITITTGGVWTFATIGNLAVNVVAGDLIEVIAPAGVDATAANFVWTFAGNG